MTTTPVLHANDDRVLMRRVANGDAAAFEAVYDRYEAQAFGLALKIVRNRAAAEEVTQDAFLSLWRGAHSFDADRGALGSWVLSVVRYRAVDSLRRGARHTRHDNHGELLLERLESDERTDRQVEEREQARTARLLIETLPSEQREVIELAYFGGFSQSEIAHHVGVPLGTVKGRARMALEKLRSSAAGDSLLAQPG